MRDFSSVYCTLKVTASFLADGRKFPVAAFNNITLGRAESIRYSDEMRSMFESIVIERTGYAAHDFFLDFTITGTL